MTILRFFFLRLDRVVDLHAGAVAQAPQYFVTAGNDLVAFLHRAHAVFVLRKRQVIVADVAAQDGVGKGFEDAAEPAAMRRFLMRDEKIFERRYAPGRTARSNAAR